MNSKKNNAKKRTIPSMELFFYVLLVLVGFYCFYDAGQLRNCSRDNIKTDTIQLLDYGETIAASRFQSWYGWIMDTNHITYAMRKESYITCRDQGVFYLDAVLDIAIDNHTTMRNPNKADEEVPFVVSVKSEGKEWVSLQNENKIRHREKTIAIFLGLIFFVIGIIGMIASTPLLYYLAHFLDLILKRY